MHKIVIRKQNKFIKQLCIIALSLISLTAFGQQKKSFVEIDSTTYALYLSSSWDELIKEGTVAIKMEMDYFYLRMRVAYGFYMKEQYRLAIPHYKEALKFNPNDAYALSYLMNCYQFSGMYNDALKLSAKLNANQLPELHKKYHSTFISAGIFYSFNKGNSNKTKPLIPFNSSENGIQKATNNFHNTAAFLSHRIGKSILINHTLDYLYKNEYTYLMIDNMEYEQDNQLVNQWNYNLQMYITPFIGFNIIPAINFIHIQIPIKSSNEDVKESTTFYSLKAQKTFNLMNLGLSYSFGHLFHTDQNQYGMHITLYPKANLNLYYGFDGYYQQQEFKDNLTSNFTYKLLIGFKTSAHWWVEASGLFPTISNFYDVNNGILFNGLERNKNMLNLKNIFLIKDSKISLIANVGIYTSVSEFLNNNNTLQKTNKHTYNNYNISGGIIWKL